MSKFNDFMKENKHAITAFCLFGVLNLSIGKYVGSKQEIDYYNQLHQNDRIEVEITKNNADVNYIVGDKEFELNNIFSLDDNEFTYYQREVHRMNGYDSLNLMDPAATKIHDIATKNAEKKHLDDILEVENNDSFYIQLKDTYYRTYVIKLNQ